METIAEQIKHYNPNKYIRNGVCLSVCDIVILDEVQKLFKSNLVYLCYASTLNNTIVPEVPVNMICILDASLPQGYIENELLNLITVSNDVDTNRLYIEVNNIIIKVERLQQGIRELSDSLLSCKGLQHIVDTGRKVLGNPIIVYDTSYKLIAYSKNIDVSKDALWPQVTKDGYCSYDLIKVMKNGQFSKVYSSELPVLFKKNSLIEYNWIAIRIQVGWNVVGHIGVLEYETEFVDSTAELLIYLSRVISNEMQKNSFISHSKGVMYEFFLSDLLDGKVLNKRAIDERVRSIELVLKEDLYVLTIRPKQDNMEELTLQYIRDFITTTIKGSKPIIYNNALVVLISFKRDRFLTELEQEELQTIMRENQMAVGVSRCFNELSDIRQFYEQSDAVLGLGIRMNEDDSIYFYEDYALYHLMHTAEEKKDLKGFCSSHIYDLMEYDRKYQTDYTYSLYVYFSAKGNMKNAAEVFGIQQNSMNYRINKIGEILKVDMRDLDIKLKLYLSIKILVFTEGTKFLQTLKEGKPLLNNKI